MEYHMELCRSAQTSETLQVCRRNNLEGEQLGDYSQRLRKKAKNTGMSCLLCDMQLKVSVSWKKTKMGR